MKASFDTCITIISSVASEAWPEVTALLYDKVFAFIAHFYSSKSISLCTLNGLKNGFSRKKNEVTFHPY